MADGRDGFDLSTLEQRIMLVILRQHPRAYGISIHQRLAADTGKRYSFGSIYATLERLEEKGLVTSRMGEPTAERGGKSKLYFTLSTTGAAALEQSLNALDVLRKGLRLKGRSA
jgi:DNA-binding PadR family transcriptional regulator